jgi:DNA-binding CsgD family transcriptional regulator/tetratricopeptide (TPR) repeat protein
MAHLARRLGEFERASHLYEESAALYQELGDQRGEAGALTNLGRIAERLGDYEKAVALHERSLGVSRRLGDRAGVATALANLGIAYRKQNNLERASDVCRESLQLRHEMGDREGIATSLENLAEVATAQHQSERAVRLWAAAAALRDAIGAPLAPSERDSYHVVVAAARSSLSPERMALIWETGRSLPLETAVQEALHGQMIPTSSGSGSPLPGPAIGLTPREVDVLQLLEAHSDREIADRLFIGARTVSTHVTSIMNKLGVNSRTSAVAYAIRRGMI